MKDRCGDGEINRRRHNRNLTNLDLAGRGWEVLGVGWWENVYNLFNNFGKRCGIMKMWREGGKKMRSEEVL